MSFCVLKDGTEDALLELAPIFQNYISFYFYSILFLKKKVKDKLFCILKDGTADALLELAPISQDTCTSAQVRRRKFRSNLKNILYSWNISFCNLSQKCLNDVPKLSHGCPEVVSKLLLCCAKWCSSFVHVVN